MTIDQGALSTQATVRVLAIDDDVRVTRLVADHLEMRGWACATAPDGDRGFTLASDGGFDLVLLDLGLPGMAGLAVLRELRRLAPDVPVIVMTGSGTAENAIRALRNGATDFITKPFHLKALDEALDRCLGASRANGDPAAASRMGTIAATEPALHRSISNILMLLDSPDDDAVHASRNASSTDSGPSRRVIEIADALGRSLALPEGDARTLRWAARLTTMPDGDLAMLESVGDAARAARLRSERWDGAGSSVDLRGEGIPMPSRCLAVAESAVAASANPDASPNDVRATLRNGAGSRFDPAVVEVCAGLPTDVLAPQARPKPSPVSPVRRAPVVAP